MTLAPSFYVSKKAKITYHVSATLGHIYVVFFIFNVPSKPTIVRKITNAEYERNRSEV